MEYLGEEILIAKFENLASTRQWNPGIWENGEQDIVLNMSNIGSVAEMRCDET